LAETAESVEQIYKARVCRPKLALKRIRLRTQQLGDLFWILKLSGCEHAKADQVFSAAARTAGHLMQLVRRKRTPAVVASRIGVGDNDRPRRKIDARRYGRCGKDRVQQSGRHHLFDQEFP